MLHDVSTVNRSWKIFNGCMCELPSIQSDERRYKVEFYDRMGRLLKARTRLADSHVHALELGWAVVDEGTAAVTFVTSILPREQD